ncbi:MAG: DUF1294 domain-containing protein [Anaerolineae bacterium]
MTARRAPGLSPLSGFGFIAMFVGVIFYLVFWQTTTWDPYQVWLAAWGLTTFIFYGLDKFQATRQSLRVPKITLHLLALVGGVFGGWAGMVVFRHKLRRISFWLVLMVSTAIHAWLIYTWYLS